MAEEIKKEEVEKEETPALVTTLMEKLDSLSDRLNPEPQEPPATDPVEIPVPQTPPPEEPPQPQEVEPPQEEKPKKKNLLDWLL